MRVESVSSVLATLSPIQRDAAEWAEGSLLVLAGPGSGKTRVLTCRIARILDATTDANFRILGLTFTNKAAAEMRDRVERIAPGQHHRLFLGTFHSFCADVIRQHGVHLGIHPNFEIYSNDADLEAILDDAIRVVSKTSEIVTRSGQEDTAGHQAAESIPGSARPMPGSLHERGIGRTHGGDISRIRS